MDMKMFLYNKGKLGVSDELAGETTGCQHAALAFYSTLVTAELRSCLCYDKVTPILQVATVSARPEESPLT